MLKTTAINSPLPSEVCVKDTIIDGKTVTLDYTRINGQMYFITRGPVRVMRLDDEWYNDVNDPPSVVQAVTESNLQVDIFTFWQRLPDIEPRYSYHTEWDSIAAMRIVSYDNWFNEQISSRTRNLIRKGMKEGISAIETQYDDTFVRGMTEIFNETPVRQGRQFWHYGKDFETIKKQFSRFLFRERLIAAYYQGQMVGFIMLGNANNYGVTGQIISKISQRDKRTNNILIAKAVELCAREGLPYLVYLYWTDDSLSEFKRRCGFNEIKIPRYFVPMTAKGQLALRLGIHRGWKQAVPKRIRTSLKTLRRRWYDLRGRHTKECR